MSISVIDNFNINKQVPLDSRLLVNDYYGLTSMSYPYVGLTTFRLDNGINYTYYGGTTGWLPSPNGIYGGSGSLIDDTSIYTGYLGSNRGDESYGLSLLSSVGSSLNGPNSRSILSSQFFLRNNSFNGYDYVEYRNQIRYIDGTGTVYSGPYLSLNPMGIRGGVSIGTSDNNYNVNERIRIESNGLIKFILVTGSTPLSINFYKDSNNKAYIGTNYDGKDSFISPGVGDSFIKFDNSTITFNHFYISGNDQFGDPIQSSNQSLFVRPNQIGINKMPTNNYALDVNGSINISSSIFFGKKDGIPYYLSNGYNGIRSTLRTDNSGLVEFISSSNGGYPITVFTYSTDQISLSTKTVAFAKTKIWDNKFNRDRVDNKWALYSFNTTISSGSYVDVLSITASTAQENYFKFRIHNYTSASSINSKEFVNSATDYDRYFYFYNSGDNYQICHKLEWYIGSDDNWKKIGNIDTGNQDSYNNDSNSETNYAIRYYSQSVLVPSGLKFRIKFSFPYAFGSDIPTQSQSPWVTFVVVRSGSFGNQTPISDTDTYVSPYANSATGWL